MLQILDELGGGVAAIGVVRRAGHPLLDVLRLGDLRRVGAADDRVVHALASDAEAVRDADLGIGGERGRLGVGVDAQDAEVLGHFLHGERSGRCLGVDQQFAAVGVDELAGDAGGFLRLALAVADHHFDRPSGETAGGVDLLDLHHHRVSRRRAELGDATRQDRRHADLDHLGLRAGDMRGGDHRGAAGSDALEHTAAAGASRSF